jgi:hypothetical protein
MISGQKKRRSGTRSVDPSGGSWEALNPKMPKWISGSRELRARCRSQTCAPERSVSRSGLEAQAIRKLLLANVLNHFQQHLAHRALRQVFEGLRQLFKGEYTVHLRPGS